VRDVQISFSQLAEDKGLLLTFDYENCIVLGDAGLIGQVLRNLLSNSIQYTSAGQVMVRFWQEDSRLMFSVADTGCGIPMEDLPFVYKEFFRSEHSQGAIRWAWIGVVHLSSRVVDRIGGVISVESSVNQGSTFTIKTNFKSQKQRRVLERDRAQLQVSGGAISRSVFLRLRLAN
jgi:signal transduction histidine kinase